MFKLNFKLYFKNIVLLIVTILSAVSFVGYLSYRGYKLTTYSIEADNFFIDPLNDIVRLSWYFIIIFMFVSYEYFSQIKRTDIQETLDSTFKSKIKAYAMQLFVMEVFAVILTVVSLIYVYAFMFSMGVNDRSYGLYMLISILLNVFILSNVGILIGLLLSGNKKRLSAYMAMFLLALFSSPISEYVIGTIAAYTGLSLYKIAYLFLLCTPGLDFVIDHSFVYSILPYRFISAFFWIFLAVGIFIFRSMKKNRKNRMLASISILLCVLSFVFVMLPDSRVIRNMDPNEFNYADDLYYSEHYKGSEIEFPQIEQQAFKISAYNMTFSVRNQLNANVEMTVDQNHLDVYCFTLYHGYKVRSVMDQDGRDLEFVQDKDYVTVKNDGRSIQKITMKYNGHSPELYSNVQGLNLPGYFAYYPRAGYQIIYNTVMHVLQPTTVENDTQFDISFPYSKKIYSNLEQDGEHSFSGKSNGVTLVSGFYKEVEAEGFTFVLPYLNSELSYEPYFDAVIDGLKEVQTSVEQSSGRNQEQAKQYDLTGKPIMLLPQPNGNSIVTVFQDHVITSGGLYSLPETLLMTSLQSEMEVEANANS